jgi:hypothetical protein
LFQAVDYWILGLAVFGFNLKMRQFQILNWMFSSPVRAGGSGDDHHHRAKSSDD